jgi:hypothetical protein
LKAAIAEAIDAISPSAVLFMASRRIPDKPKITAPEITDKIATTASNSNNVKPRFGELDLIYFAVLRLESLLQKRSINRITAYEMLKYKNNAGVSTTE